jgi:hypothetical protein
LLLGTTLKAINATPPARNPDAGNHSPPYGARMALTLADVDPLGFRPVERLLEMQLRL